MKQNADVWAAFDNLERSKPALTKSAFSRLEQATGLNYSSVGMLADAELRRHVLPIACHTYDSMHTFWSNGLAAAELHLFLQACANKLDLRYAALDMLCKADWGHCKHMPLKLKHIFTETRERACSTSFKAMASEVISVMPVVAYFAETVVEPTGHLQDEVASFKAFHAVGVLVQKAKFGVCTPLQLQSALRRHLPLFVKAYGPEWVLIEVEAHWSWARYERASTPSLFDPAAGVCFAGLWVQDGDFFKLLLRLLHARALGA